MRIVRFLFLPLLSAAFASAQGETGVAPIFAHDALSCMSIEDFPIVEAVLEPAELRALEKAQVYFKASDSNAWYPKNSPSVCWLHATRWARSGVW